MATTSIATQDLTPTLPTLLPHHAALLFEESAIAPEVAAERGYWSATDPAVVANLGFAPYQCRVPALVVPIYNTAGRRATHQLRPDDPRTDADDRPIKYETPFGTGLVIDVHPRLRMALRAPAVPLIVTEGVRKADAAISYGHTCLALMGVYGWRGRNEHGVPVTLDDLDDIAIDGRRVDLIFDSDLRTNPNVRRALDRLKTALERRGSRVRVIYLPAGADGTKVGLDDYLAAGGNVTDLPVDADRPNLSSTADQMPASVAAWPEALHPAAFQGLAGEIVGALLPHTEADPSGLLLTLLAAVGNIVGPGPHWAVSGRPHPLLIWPILVGATAKGRKGTTWGTLRPVLGRAAPEWLTASVSGGLASGEGVIWAIRDPITKREAGVEVTIDPGVSEKRLCLIEEEWGGTLKVANREGNSLSAVLRKAWDGDALGSLTKNAPARATDPHVTVIGHTTAEELRRNLDDTQIASGLGNRHLFICVRRSKLLPDGGALDRVVIEELGDRLREVLGHATAIEEIRRDEAASDLWRRLYGPLSEGSVGLLGALTSRAEAQVMRLAAIYAVLDGEALIRPEHLRAAVAVWDYAEASVSFIFGDRLGDPIADAILQALQVGELTQTEVSELFGRNVSAAKLHRALGALLAAEKVQRDQRPSGGSGGRPTLVWGLTHR